MLLLSDGGGDVGGTGSPGRGRGMRYFVRHFAGARQADSPPRDRSHPAQAECDPPPGAGPCPATLSGPATTGPCLADCSASCHTVSRCAHDALPTRAHCTLHLGSALRRSGRVAVCQPLAADDLTLMHLAGKRARSAPRTE